MPHDGDGPAAQESMNPSDRDETMMRMAIKIAIQGRGFVEPNPVVGCVIATGDTVIAKGHHESFGGPHAEVNALANVPQGSDLSQGSKLSGATAYVTLEPCCHHGKTPPCSEAMIASGIRRVVVGTVDPFAEVNGGGIASLRNAGIEVVVGVCQDQCRRLIAPFAKKIATGNPWVTAKWAMTMDGRIATVTGQSQWISSSQSRQDVHRTRGKVDAIIVGMGTVLADDPTLTARPSDPDDAGPRTPQRIVFCRHRLPAKSSRLVSTIDEAPLTLVTAPGVNTESLATLVELGVRTVPAPSGDSRAMVRAAMIDFQSRCLNHVLVEGGGELLASFFEADAIDACDIYVGAKVFGGASALGPIAGNGIPLVSDALNFELDRVEVFGNDVKLSYQKRV